MKLKDGIRVTASNFYGDIDVMLRGDGGVATFDQTAKTGSPTYLWGFESSDITTTSRTYHKYSTANLAVNTATKLASSVKLWGNDFNGSTSLTGAMTFGTLAMATNYTDTWSDGTNTHPWYGYDHRYVNTGPYSTTISDYHGLSLRTGSGILSMLNGGNVGIGTYTPDLKLLISGGLLKVTNNSLSITIGATSSDYCNINATKPIAIGTSTYFRGHVAPIYSNYYLGSSSSRWSGLYTDLINASGTVDGNKFRSKGSSALSYRQCLEFINDSIPDGALNKRFILYHSAQGLYIKVVATNITITSITARACHGITPQGPAATTLYSNSTGSKSINIDYITLESWLPYLTSGYDLMLSFSGTATSTSPSIKFTTGYGTVTWSTTSATSGSTTSGTQIIASVYFDPASIMKPGLSLWGYPHASASTSTIQLLDISMHNTYSSSAYEAVDPTLYFHGNIYANNLYAPAGVMSANELQLNGRLYQWNDPKVIAVLKFVRSSVSVSDSTTTTLTRYIVNSNCVDGISFNTYSHSNGVITISFNVSNRTLLTATGFINQVYTTDNSITETSVDGVNRYRISPVIYTRVDGVTVKVGNAHGGSKVNPYSYFNDYALFTNSAIGDIYSFTVVVYGY